MTNPELEPGLSGDASLTVTDDDTAIAFGSGDVPVLATPRIVALAEEATCAAVAPRLAEHETTVGIRVELDHTRPTGLGGSVTADALLSHVDGRRLEFDIVVRDEVGQVASGRVTRVAVDRERFVTGLT
jgi:predicted thioesterase